MGGNCNLTNTVERLMLMFKIGENGLNSFAVGFPKTNINRQESESIFQSKREMNEYYSKGLVSRSDEGAGKSAASQIIWPPKNKRIPGTLEVSFSIGNFQHCIGILTLKKSS